MEQVQLEDKFNDIMQRLTNHFTLVGPRKGAATPSSRKIFRGEIKTLTAGKLS